MLENILLLSCRSPFLDSDRVYPPLANLYLHQAIKERHPNVKVTVADDYDLEDSRWLLGYDGVGVSIMTPQRSEAKKLLDFIKTRRPDIKVFAGGPHVKHYLKDIEAEPWDYLVPNDGVRAISAILTGDSRRILNDIITIKEYPTVWVKPNRTDNAMFLNGYNYKLQGRESTTMLTAQGCPMSCSFCEDANTTTRWTPIEKIREELDDIRRLGYGGIYLFDDLFAIAMQKVKPIAEELDKRGFIYRCNGQANFFTKWGEEFAKLLSQTGCVEIAFGHESGSQTILNNVDKRTSVEQNYKSVEYARKHGIKVKSFILIGLPGETQETLQETERFIRDAAPDDFQCAVYTAFKGTKIRDAIDRGETIDMQMMVPEVMGAYGVKGGETTYEVRTSALSVDDLKAFRNYLVDTYRPKSHSPHFQDKFFDTAHEPGEVV